MISLTRSLHSLVCDIKQPLAIKTISHPQPFSNLFINIYCKTHYNYAPFISTHFALGDDSAYITGADTLSD